MGRRFGKNEVGSACVIDYATQPDSYSFGDDETPVCWWVGPTYRQAYLYGFLKVKEKIPDILIDEDNTRGSEWSPSKITLYDGTVIEFLSYGNPSGLQGAGVDIIVGDEWAYSEESLWHNDLRPMLMDTGGGAVLISKPLGENHFFNQYEQGQSDDHSEWASWHATAYENPFIPDSEVDKAKKTTPESVFRQEYMADPRAGGTLLTLDMLSTISPERFTEKSDRWKWHVAVDVGVQMDEAKARENDNDYWAASIVAEHPQKSQAYVLQVARDRGQTPDKAANWIANVLSDVPTNRVYYEAVQAQSWFARNLQDAGLQAIPVEHDRPKEERITFLSVPFSNGNVKLVSGVDWSDFRNEWAAFPGGNHDDQLDSTEMALRHCNFADYTGWQSTNPYEEQQEDVFSDE